MFSPGYRLLRRVIGTYAALDRSVLRVHTALEEAAHGVLSRALDARERSDLSVYLGARANPTVRSTLFSWELPWFQSDLPPPPARLLLGAAGSGREAAWLTARGYAVDAFEPARSCEPRLASAVGSLGRCAFGSYEDLVLSVLTVEASPLSHFASERYDAVILGWGSLTHVIDPDMRRNLLQAADRLSPHGPILASFWARDEGPPPPPRRARAAGAAVGGWLGRLRGRSASVSPHDGFRTHSGFTRPLARSELEALAADVGRTCAWYADAYPHVTLRRRP